MHVECIRQGEWWSKIVNNICVTRDYEIQDMLVFVYLDIHLTICQNPNLCNLILQHTSFVIQAEVLKFAYTSANLVWSLTSETQTVSAHATNS